LSISLWRVSRRARRTEVRALLLLNIGTLSDNPTLSLSLSRSWLPIDTGVPDWWPVETLAESDIEG
jgi:hypothetical protein